METLEFPVFSTETDPLAELPTSTLPNARLAGLATKVRVVEETPVPARDAVSEPSILVETLADPEMVPADCGVKCSAKETLFPPAMVSGSVSPVRVNAEAEMEVL
jgi:hypothetical protein